MSRPEVSLESIEKIDALYDYYEHHVQNQAFARTAHFLLSKVYKPTFTFEDGAEEAIDEAVHSETRLVNVANHLTGDDQFIFVVGAEKVKALQALRGRTFIPTKPSLSTASLRRGGQLLRRAVDGLGSIPIIRLEDFKRRGIEITPELLEMHNYAMRRADETEVSKLVNQGNHMAGFPESTRNRIDHTKVQPLKNGIGFTVCKAAELVEVAMLPWGMYYGGEPKDYKELDVPAKRTPHVHIGMPIRVDPIQTSPKELMQEHVHPAIQHCVDVAVQACLDRES